MRCTRTRTSWLVTILAASLMLLQAAVPGAAAGPDAKDQCKQGGWQDLTTDGITRFRNQGQCVSFVAHGNTPLPPGRIAFGTLRRQSSWECIRDAYAINIPLGSYTLTIESAASGHVGSRQISITSDSQNLEGLLILYNRSDTWTVTLSNGAQTYRNAWSLNCDFTN